MDARRVRFISCFSTASEIVCASWHPANRARISTDLVLLHPEQKMN